MARYQVYLHIDLVEAVPKSGVQSELLIEMRDDNTTDDKTTGLAKN